MQYTSRKDQVNVYVQKFIRNFKNDKGWISFIEALIIPVIVRLITGKDDFLSGNGEMSAYILTCACLWLGIFNSITNICKEKDIVKHELRQGLAPSSYMLANLQFQFLVCIIQSVIITIMMTIFYFKNMSILTVFGTLITVFLVTYGADVLGLLTSALVKNVETAMMVMPFILIVQLVLAGNIPLDQTYLKILSFIMISKNGYDSFLSLQGRTGEARIQGLFGGSAESFFDNVDLFLLCWVIIIISIIIFTFISQKKIEKLAE